MKGNFGVKRVAKLGQRGSRKLKNLGSSINYDGSSVMSRGVSRDRDLIVLQ